MNPKYTNKQPLPSKTFEERLDEKFKEIGDIPVEQQNLEKLPTTDLSRQMSQIGAIDSDSKARTSVATLVLITFCVTTIMLVAAMMVVFIGVGLRPVVDGTGGVHDLQKLMPFIDRPYNMLAPVVMAALGYYFGAERRAGK